MRERIGEQGDRGGRVRRARVVSGVALGAAVLGALVGTRVGVDPVWWLGAAFVVSVVGVMWRGGRSWALVVGLGLVMGGIGAQRVDLGGRGWLARELDAARGVRGGRVLVEVRGVVVERVVVEERESAVWEPAMWSGVVGRTALRVEAVRVGERWVEARGELGLTLGAGAIGSMGCGDGVEVVCSARGVSGAMNPGEPDWRLRAAHDGVVGRAHVDDGAQVRVVGRGGVGGVVDRVRAWRASMRGRVVSAMGLEGAGVGGVGGVDEARRVVGALTLGERNRETRELERAFARTGVAHVLAVSGLHVGVIAGVGVMLGVLGGERGRVRALVLGAVFVWIGVVFPVEVPIVRALVLLGALGVARGFGRRFDPVCVLCWCAVGLLVWRPMDAGGMGYQLSVGITGLLLVVGTREGALSIGKVPGRGVKMRALGAVWGGLKLNAGCWALATPVVVAHTGVVSVVGAVLAGPIAVVAAAVLVGGTVVGVVGMVDPELAHRGLGVVDAMGSVMVGVVRWVDGGWWSSVRGVWVGGGVVGWVWALLATWVVWVVVTGARVWRDRRWWVVGMGCVLCAWAVGATVVGGRIEEGVRVDMLSVGDGSAIVVRSGGDVMLYDAGSLDFRAGGMIERALRSMGVRGIDVVVVSHDNLDHFDALPELAGLMRIDRVLVGESMFDAPSEAWSAAMGVMRGHGVEFGVLRAGEGFGLGGARVVCVRGGGLEASVNDRSLVLRVEVGEERAGVLLTGDIGGRAIGALMEQMEGEGWIDEVRVMEMPHHGSWNHAAAALIEVVDPGVVLQSTGAGRVGDARFDGVRGERAWIATGNTGAVWALVGEDGDGAGVVSGRFGDD